MATRRCRKRRKSTTRRNKTIFSDQFKEISLIIFQFAPHDDEGFTFRAPIFSLLTTSDADSCAGAPNSRTNHQLGTVISSNHANHSNVTGCWGRKWRQRRPFHILWTSCMDFSDVVKSRQSKWTRVRHHLWTLHPRKYKNGRPDVRVNKS